MSLIDRSGLSVAIAGAGAGGGSEQHAERSPKSLYNDEVRVVESFILVEEIMRRRYNVTVRLTSSSASSLLLVLWKHYIRVLVLLTDLFAFRTNRNHIRTHVLYS